MKRALLIAAAIAALVAGCTAISRLPALQPPAVPTSPPVSIGAATGTVPIHSGFARGVDIDAYTYPGQDVAAAARADMAYIKSLHADAVSVSFPFFITGAHSAGVYTTRATPTPAQLAVIVGAGVSAGLTVTVRPLMDEGSIHRCRCSWRPLHPRRWFTSYQDFLLPYAVAAQSAGAAELVVGTEFTHFAYSPQWAALDQAVRAVFHGQLACDSNWGKVNIFTGSCGLPGPAQEVDAYPPMRGNLVDGWEVFDAIQARHVVESEVGIDGVAGAYSQPYRHRWPNGVLDPAVQARWFTAACHAAVTEHLGGIYFWSIGLGPHPDAPPTLLHQGNLGGAGAQAIAQCFAQIERGGK